MDAAENYLETDSGHKIWYGVTGDSKGVPVVNIHGGPGSYSKPSHLGKFHLDKHLVIQIDQRGAGKSTPSAGNAPSASLENNTTADLIADIEAIREKLKIESWFVVGDSWGATLALAYSLLHPDRVRGLYLGSIFLGDTETDQWVFGDRGAGSLYPELAKHRLELLGELKEQLGDKGDEVDKLSDGIQGNPTIAQWFGLISHALQSDDAKLIQLGIKAVVDYEFNLGAIGNSPEIYTEDKITEDLESYARIFAHYASNSYFLEGIVPALGDSEEENKERFDALADIPVSILHGRHDILSTVSNAYKLHKALPHSTLEILENCGHGFNQEGKLLAKYMIERLMRGSN